MVLQKEIRDIAEKLQLPGNTIDKDYVLGHFLNGLFGQEWAQDNLLFKGGTCLKKCYFENYRFSEDIDATIVNPKFDLKRRHIQQVCDQVTDISGIAFKILSFKPVEFNDMPIGWDVEVCFWGANHERNKPPVFGKDCHTKIWCEFRSYEQVLFQQNRRKIFHFYSDVELIQSTIPCYDVHEILAEKLRALIQRNRGEARDYFDIWYIKDKIANINWQSVKNAFLKKCEFKNTPFRNSNDFFQPKRLNQVQITWDKRLRHQLPKNFDVETSLIIEDLKTFLFDLFDEPL